MEFDFTTFESALMMLGQRLLQKKQHYEIVAIGGAGLVLLGYIDRTTKDLDLIALMNEGNLISAKPLPQALQREIAAVGMALELNHNWINGAPTSLLDTGLPEGFLKRLAIRKYGGLTIHFAGRLDQICFKL